MSLVQSHTLGKRDPCPYLSSVSFFQPRPPTNFLLFLQLKIRLVYLENNLISLPFLSSTPPSQDRGIIMTFGSGSNGCLGHGSLNDISQVGVACALGRRKSGRWQGT